MLWFPFSPVISGLLGIQNSPWRRPCFEHNDKDIDVGVCRTHCPHRAVADGGAATVISRVLNLGIVIAASMLLVHAGREKDRMKKKIAILFLTIVCICSFSSITRILPGRTRSTLSFKTELEGYKDF